MSDSDDCDWFDKDVDKLVEDLQAKKQRNREENEEYIAAPSTKNIDDFIINLSFEGGRNSKHGKEHNRKCVKMPIADLRKLVDLAPIEILPKVHILKYDFYSNQIDSNDSAERVQLYTFALAAICRLEVPGFREDCLKTVAYDDSLQHHFRLLLAKLLCLKFDCLWTEEDKKLEFIANMELLILKSFKVHRKVEKFNMLLKDLLKILDLINNTRIAEKPFYNALKANISAALKTSEITEENIDIFPTLEDLNKEQTVFENPLYNIPSTSQGQQTAQEYLAKHLNMLKQDVFFPLKERVDLLKNRRSTTEQPDNFFVYDDVYIVLNERYLAAFRYEMIRVDVLGSTRNMDAKEPQPVPHLLYENMKKIKVGSLLCFSTSNSFDDLILATAMFTSAESMKDGFIGIEIARQYDIAKIYNRKFIMFESPAFFEPYHKTFNYLKNCTISNFPLKKYLVDGEIPDKQIPNYLSENTIYDCDGRKFKLLTEEPPQNVLGLNECQLKAYKKALTQELCVIQGPPGTGKTHLSLQLVKTLIKNADTPVVLITYTNDSLDKLLIKISEYTQEIVRFGAQSKDPKLAKYNVKEISLDAVHNINLRNLFSKLENQYKHKFEYLQQKYKDFNRSEESYQKIVKGLRELSELNEKMLNVKVMFHYDVTKKKSIIAFTTTGAAKNNYVFRMLKSKIVIFEEAAEILESHIVACLTPYTEHVIMIGDHLQLQPFSSSHQLRQACEMNISLFEKIFKLQKNPIQLKTQYRMHPIIADLLCKIFYQDFECHVSVTQYPNVRKMKTNLFFMHHTIEEGKTALDASLYNDHECKEIVKLAAHLVTNARYSAEDIVILSPYAKQVQHITNQLAYNYLNKIKVSTVDTFQGLESKIILLSLVRSNKNSKIGFLSRPNRICVALSRAKHGMYIIGNISLLSQCCSTWRQIEEKLIQLKAIGAAFPMEL